MALWVGLFQTLGERLFCQREVGILSPKFFIKNEQQRVTPVLDFILPNVLEHYKESHACRLARRGNGFCLCLRRWLRGFQVLL